MNSDRIHGIITRGVGGLYGVRVSENEEVLCRARGILRREQITPTVGDEVVIELGTREELDAPLEAEDTSERGSRSAGKNGRPVKKEYHSKKNDVSVDYVIDEIMPRRNLLIRPPVANLDYLFAVIPCASPEPDLLTADKLTVIAENYGIETVVVINKADIDPSKADSICEIYNTAGYKTFKVSCESGEGIPELSAYIREISSSHENLHVSGAFAGVSGAGKSTLMSALFPGLELKTGTVSRKTERGRHTTRHVELYPVDMEGCTFWIADTPGFSMLDFTRFDFFPYDELAVSFREFAECIGACRYTKCTHLREEGCAVIEKMHDGRIAKSRHESYIRIYEEQRSVPEWKRR